MKLTGYYMTAICKFEDGIKTICVVDAQNRAQMLERLKAAYRSSRLSCMILSARSSVRTFRARTWWTSGTC